MNTSCSRSVENLLAVVAGTGEKNSIFRLFLELRSSPEGMVLDGFRLTNKGKNRVTRDSNPNQDNAKLVAYLLGAVQLLNETDDKTQLVLEGVIRGKLDEVQILSFEMGRRGRRYPVRDFSEYNPGTYPGDPIPVVTPVYSRMGRFGGTENGVPKEEVNNRSPPLTPHARPMVHSIFPQPGFSLQAMRRIEGRPIDKPESDYISEEDSPNPSPNPSPVRGACVRRRLDFSDPEADKLE